MKRLLCIILTLTILVSIFSISATAIVAPEDSVPINQKEIIKQRFFELHGEDGILKEGLNYTWNFNQGEDTEELENPSYVATPYWSSSEKTNPRVTHYEIIDMANEDAKLNGGPYISDEYLLLVKKYAVYVIQWIWMIINLHSYMLVIII